MSTLFDEKEFTLPTTSNDCDGMLGAYGKKATITNHNTGEIYRPYARILIKRRTPEEILSCKQLRDEEDFMQRVVLIGEWYRDFVKDKNVVLEFRALEIDDEELAQFE